LDTEPILIKFLLRLGLLILLCSTLFAQTAGLRGVITDESGAIVPGTALFNGRPGIATSPNKPGLIHCGMRFETSRASAHPVCAAPSQHFINGAATPPLQGERNTLVPYIRHRNCEPLY